MPIRHTPTTPTYQHTPYSRSVDSSSPFHSRPKYVVPVSQSDHRTVRTTFTILLNDFVHVRTVGSRYYYVHQSSISPFRGFDYFVMESVSLDALRSIVQDSLGKHLYENAIFFADKLVALTRSPDDIFRLVQGYVFTTQYRRALHVLQANRLTTAESRFRYITAKCLVECQEWEECLSLLEDDVLAAVKVCTIHEHPRTGDTQTHPCVLDIRDSGPL